MRKEGPTTKTDFPFNRPSKIVRILWIFPIFLTLAAPLLVEGEASAQARPRTRIAVLTMTPGAAAFEKFGHAALLVEHPDEPDADPLVYNYGTFDYGTPNVMWKFLRRELHYWVSISTWGETQLHYARRTITLRRLALTDEEASTVAARLTHNALPENREYRYEFFRDNCSTRVRDVVAAIAPELRQAGESLLGHASFRGHVAAVLTPVPLFHRAVDLVLNDRVDVPTTRWDDAFLPRELGALLDETRRPDGQPLVASRSDWVGPEYQPDRAPITPTGLLWAGLLVPLALGGALARPGRARRPAARVATGIGLALWGLVTGLVGTLLVFFSLTPWEVARANGNLAALWPATLVLVPYGIRLALGRVPPVGIERLQALLVALLAPIAIDLGLHLVGRAAQAHVAVLLYVLGGHLVALAAVTLVGPRRAPAETVPLA